jgi:hypothetical protein
MTTRAFDLALLFPTDVPAAGEALSFSAAFRMLWAPFAGTVSPIFTGDPQAPTPAAADNDQSIATTAFVKTSLLPYAPLASPAFTGNPTAPTPAPGDSDTSVATTAFVQNAVVAGTTGVASWNTRTGAVVLNNADVIAVLPGSAALPVMNGVAAAGSATAWSRADHVHPSDTGATFDVGTY